MRKINDKVFALETVSAFEHTYEYSSTKAENERTPEYSELWCVDVYSVDPLRPEQRFFVWADSTADTAAEAALPLVRVNGDYRVILTHITPVNDRQREPV